MQSQWRAGGLGVIGLDYGIALRLARLLNIEITPAVFKKIQALEGATLKQINMRPGT